MNALRSAAYAALVVSSCAWAAEPQTLPPVVVRGAPDDAGTLTPPSLKTSTEILKRVPGGANVVDAETFRENRASTLTDALRYSPGVFVQPRFGAEEARISIRGSGIQRTFHLRGIRILQDGIPVNLADGSGDFQAIEPLAARYIEVFRGANALQYGSTTLGGAVNYVSPSGHDGPPLQLRAEAGSFDYRRFHLASGQGFERGDYFASFSTFDQTGFRHWSDQSAQRFFGHAGMRINSDVETRFYVGYVNTISRLPGAITKAQLEADPRRANPGNIAGQQKRDFDLWRLANKTTVRFEPGRLEVSGFYSEKVLFHPIFQVLDQDSQDYGVEARWVTDAPLFGRKNRFIAGVSPSRGDLIDDRWVNAGGTRGARTNRFDQTATNLALYAENQHYAHPQWSVVTGAQYTRTRRRNVDQFITAPAGNESFDLTYSAVSPKLGFVHDYSPTAQFFGNVSRSFEPPSFGELAGGATPVFNRAQKATTFEVGTRGTTAATTWDFAYYYAKVDDELLQVATNTAGLSVTVNAPRTVHQGVELGFTRRFGPVEWRQALLWNRFRFDDDPTFANNTLPGLPKTFLTGELVYRGPYGLFAGPTFEWSPQRYSVDMANTFYADDYAVVGFKLGQRIGRNWLWFVDGRNLANRRYAATTNVTRTQAGADGPQFFPGDGRSVYAGIQWQM